MIHISVFHGKDTDKLSLDDLKEPTDVKKTIKGYDGLLDHDKDCLLYTSPSPRDKGESRKPG